ncbi:phosphatase PAP2 family protein [Sporosarcina sp. G11-34]|uniref:phosphatase PAP2 family protein n=1 Tax=Sporosarcina sp. G11-34 TaxID=2849605 RepID=UPI0022A8D397|nr:phosphatase PAP2 family protein [Sporosarcina sp. G11-34]MCZ2259742.1 phosphatase PAP2 family protein [Sporosarcina sp. G11-34]
MRELSLRLLITFIICIGLGVAFGYISAAIGNEAIVGFDTAVIVFVQGLETPWLTSIMKLFTWVGSRYVVVAIALMGFIVLYFVLCYRQQAFLLISVVAGSVLLNKLLKNYFKRERPEIHRIMDANGYSFPSGHSMMAFALYAIIAYIAWRDVKRTVSRVLLVVFTPFMIIMIGTSRVYLGVHYPSDIVGGFVASALWLTIATSVSAYFQNKREKKERPFHVNE